MTYLRVTPNIELTYSLNQLEAITTKAVTAFPDFVIPVLIKNEAEEVVALVDDALNVSAKERVRRENLFSDAAKRCQAVTRCITTVAIQHGKMTIKRGTWELLQKLGALKVHRSLAEEHEVLGRKISKMPLVLERREFNLEQAGRLYRTVQMELTKLEDANTAVNESLKLAELMRTLPSVTEEFRKLKLRVEAIFLPRTWTIQKQMVEFRELASVGNGGTKKAIALYQAFTTSISQLTAAHEESERLRLRAVAATHAALKYPESNLNV